jgi:hypothetical protein
MNTSALSEDFSATLTDTMTETGISIPRTDLIATNTPVDFSNPTLYSLNKLHLTLNATNTVNNIKIKVEMPTEYKSHFQLWSYYASNNPGDKTNWINSLTDGLFLGDQKGYSVKNDGTTTIDFYLLGDLIGTNYQITFKLYQGNDTNVIETFTYNFDVVGSHSFNTLSPKVFPYSGLFTGTPTALTDLPTNVQSGVTGINLRANYYSYIEHALIKIDVITGDKKNIQLWAKDTANHWYDLSQIGYWGPSTGFSIGYDPITPAQLYNQTTNIYLMSNKMGDYKVKISLIDAENPTTIYAAQTYDFSVGPVVQAHTIADQTFDRVIGNTTYRSIFIYHMDDPMTIYGNLFQQLKDQGKSIVFQSLNSDDSLKYGWSFDGTLIYDNVTAWNTPIDLLINTSDDTTNHRYTFDFNHDGALPGKTLITAKVDPYYMGTEDLWLYRYDASTNKYTFAGISVSKDSTTGTVQFTIDHCSTYVMTTALIEDAFGNPSTGDINVALFSCLGLFSLIGAAFAVKKTILNK